MAKFKRAIQKIKIMKKLKISNSKILLEIFSDAKETVVYNLFFALLSIWIILQPVFVLDRSFINEVTDCYNFSALLTLFFVIELFFIY